MVSIHGEMVKIQADFSRQLRVRVHQAVPIIGSLYVFLVIARHLFQTPVHQGDFTRLCADDGADGQVLNQPFHPGFTVAQFFIQLHIAG